jgi:hypothetical protein
MSSDQKQALVEDVYCNRSNHGRLGYANVLSIPLTPDEVGKIETLTGHDAELFLSAHGVAPMELRKHLAAH